MPGMLVAVARPAGRNVPEPPERRLAVGLARRYLRAAHGWRSRKADCKSAPVRLRGQWDRAVKVRFCAVKSCAVSNRNCIAAMRGGEQRNENDQSVTQVVPEDSRGELDSVGVDGRVFERKTKPAKRAIGASQIAGQPGGPRTWHRWLETEWSAVPRPKSGRPAGDKRCSWPQGPKNRPAGVRASVVAKKRVTTVEPRDAGKWMRDGRERRE